MKKEHTKAAQDGSQQKRLNSSPLYAGVMIYCANVILLAKRIERCPITNQTPAFPGYWSIFCGSIEGKESPKQCAQRELFEETKIKINKDELIYVCTIDSLAIYKHELQELQMPDLNFEHTECGWFKMENIQVQPDPIDKKIIELVKQHQQEA